MGMLVLDRDEAEAIQVGEFITVKLVRARNGKARLGINAPRHIPIIRLDRDGALETGTGVRGQDVQEQPGRTGK